MESTITQSRQAHIFTFISLLLLIGFLFGGTVYFHMLTQMKVLKSQKQKEIDVLKSKVAQKDSLRASFYDQIQSMYFNFEALDDINLELSDEKTLESSEKENSYQDLNKVFASIQDSILSYSALNEKIQDPIYSDFAKVLSQLAEEKINWGNSLYNNQVGTYTKRLNELSSENNRLQAIIRDGNYRRSRLGQTNESLEGELSQLSSNNSSLLSQINQLNQEKKDLLQKVNDCRTNSTALKALVKNMTIGKGYAIKEKDKAKFDALLEELINQ